MPKRTAEQIKAQAKAQTEIIELLLAHIQNNNLPQIELVEWKRAINQRIRRYQQYCINENVKYETDGYKGNKKGTHYREVGVTGKVINEHVNPITGVIDDLIAGKKSVADALNTPSVLLSKAMDDKLNESKLTTVTVDAKYPFRRYADLGIRIETFDGQEIDMHNWSIDHHRNYFVELQP